MTALDRVSLGDLFTLANGALGFIAIVFIFDESYLSATGLLILSLVMDGLDGFMARTYGSKHTRGQVLDSISDSISFAFAPALLIYAQFQDPTVTPLQTIQDTLVLACAVSVMLSGLYRLARFSAGGHQLGHFAGLPAPAATLFLLLICLLFGAGEGAEPTRYYFSFGETAGVVLPLALVAAFLMASTIPYPKVRGWIAVASSIGVAIAFMPTVAGIVIVGDQQLYTAFSRTATGVALALTIVYLAGGPLYERWKRAEV
jgi:CDP-diacylglycerol--serine O-phosphatidyltransferase